MERNKEKNNKKKREYYHNHPEKVKEKREKQGEKRKEWALNWYKKHRETVKERIKIKNEELKKLNISTCGKNYKISNTQIIEMYIKQNGVCAMCGRKRKLVIDHCHKTNKVRGLLCTTCNSGLGFFSDSVVYLEKGIMYLEKNGATKNEKLLGNISETNSVSK